MRPETAVARRMRITLYVSVLVVNAMCCHPEKRPALKRESSTYGKEVFNPLVSLVPAMREQSVVAHADTEAAGNPPQQDRDKKCFPREHEKGYERADMECDHEKRCELADGLLKRAVTLKKFHEYWFLLGDFELASIFMIPSLTAGKALLCNS